MTDREQADLMWKLRVKIDKWSQGVEESIRQRNRLLLLDLYLELPPRRVWLFAKLIRFAHFMRPVGSDAHVLFDVFIQQSEDIIVRSKYAYLEIRIPTDKIKASRIIRPNRLAQLIYKATMNDIWIKQRPKVSLWGKITELDHQAREQLILLHLLDSVPPRKFPCLPNRIPPASV